MNSVKAIFIVCSVLILTVSIHSHAQGAAEPQVISAPASPAAESTSTLVAPAQASASASNRQVPAAETTGASASTTQPSAPSSRGRVSATGATSRSPLATQASEATTSTTSRRQRTGDSYGGGGASGGYSSTYGASQQPMSSSVQSEPMVTKIYKLKYAIAQQVSEILKGIKFSGDTRFIPDNRTNSIIVCCSEKDMEQVEPIVSNLDVEQDLNTPSSGMMGGMGMSGMGGMGMGGMNMGMMGSMPGSMPQSEPTNVAYLVYAVEAPVEIPADQLNMKHFDLVLECNTEKRIIIDASSIDVEGLVIGSFQIDEGDRDGGYTSNIRIEGYTQSIDNIRKIIEDLDKKYETKCVLESLRTGATMQTGMSGPSGEYPPLIGSTDTAQPVNIAVLNSHIQLPGELENTVKKLLNNDVKTVGYWFGNSALPGECMAPIGQWQLTLNSQANNDSSFLLNIDLSQGEKSILSNSINARIEQPIIIGYTRIQGGVLCPGALVVIPQREF